MLHKKALTSWTIKGQIKEGYNSAQSAFTCSKLIIETLEQGVKYVQS